MRAGVLIFLAASEALFLWMFLSADPLEQIAVAPGAAGPKLETDAAMRFAAEWRHGMAGNSPLYLPGFFLTAAAAWMHAARTRQARRHLTEIMAATSIALLVASVAAPWGAKMVVGAFAARHDLPVPPWIPAPSIGSLLVGLYTLFTWTVFTICARTSLVRRNPYPLLVPAVLTIILINVRPWTVNDFVGFWANQLVAGTAVAWWSFAAAIGFSTALVRCERATSPQPQPGAEGSAVAGAPAADNQQQVTAEDNRVEAGGGKLVEERQRDQRRKSDVRRGNQAGR
jgi:hypothetical protein